MGLCCKHPWVGSPSNTVVPFFVEMSLWETVLECVC